MNTDNKTTRELAIKWWNKLSDTKRRKLTFQYMGDMPLTFAGIADENEITGLYLSEHPTQPEQTIKEESKTIEELKEENKLLREALRKSNQWTLCLLSDIEAGNVEYEEKYCLELNQDISEAANLLK